MSGGGNSGDEGGGYDLNAFGDWGGMFNVLGATGSGSSPGTQGSATPAYQTPSFPVDAYYRPPPLLGPRSSQTQGLSQIREDIPEEPTPEAVPEGDDGGRHLYTQAETMAVFDAWISTSNDPILGNQQNRKGFWEKVTAVYNAKKPRGAVHRNLKMVRAHFERADRDVKKFCGIYKREAEQYQSGASGADILRAALRIFKSDTGKDFKFPDVWEAVKHIDRWAGGVDSCTGSSSKRTKHTASGQYSSSEGGQDSASQEVEFPTSDAGGDAGGSSSTQRRPQGTKAAKAARGRGRGRGRGESSQAGFQGSPSTLMSMYFTATMADTSRMTPPQYEAHLDGIEHLRSQLGIRPRSNLGAPPPTSGDESPAE